MTISTSWRRTYTPVRINSATATRKQKKNCDWKGRWHSFLPSETHPRGMKPIAKRKWEDLEAVIVALKWKDLKDSYLHIRRMEQKQYEQLENGKWKKHLEVVEHIKSDAGYRTLYVVSSAMELFDKVKEANLRNGYSCKAKDYIFMYRKHSKSMILHIFRRV